MKVLFAAAFSFLLSVNALSSGAFSGAAVVALEETLREAAHKTPLPPRFQNAPWRTISHEKFNVFHHVDDSLNAATIASILHDEYPSISRELGSDVSAPIGVFITKDQAQFTKMTGGGIPHWGEAVANPKRQIIYLKSPRWSQIGDHPRTVVVHELVHILVGNAVRDVRVPRWLTEGLAVYFSGDLEHIGATKISQAQLNDQLLTLREIERMLVFGHAKANLAYQQSYFAVVYLAEKYDASAFPLLLNALNESGGIDGAFQEVYGFSVAEFEREWRAYLKSKYRWSFLAEFDTLLWVFIPLLFLLAVVISYFRNRRKKAQLDAEEDQYASPYDPENDW